MLCAVPLQIEWFSPDTGWDVIAWYLLPVLVLAVGTVTRRPLALMFGFPSALIPAYLVLPTLDRMVIGEGATLVPLAGLLVFYSIAAALWCEGRIVSPAGSRDGRKLPSTPRTAPRRGRDLWWPYRTHFAPRMVIVVALFVVPVYGLNFADGVTERYAANFVGDAQQAQVMANVLALFGWVVVSYLLFVSPGLNLELEQRELDRTLARVQGSLTTRWRPRVVLGLVLATALLVVLFGVTLR